MQFRFDANQEFQQRAVASVADVFQAMPRVSQRQAVKVMGTTFDEGDDQLDIDPARLLDNIKKVQRANKLPEDDDLRSITETVDVGGTKRAVTFPNLSVEMETGTGKTYVYLRTALELNKRFGLRKFVIVVPSVAVREGVLKTFQVTKDHFADLFDNEPYRFEVYDSKNLTRLRNFAREDAVRFLVMTIDSFNKEQNVIRSRTDRLQGQVGLHLLQAVRPVLILDEPQNMESAARKQALATLNPLAALRYSATHREKYNLLYRLTPSEAYRQGLVKKIEVASVLEADSFNAPYIRVEGFATSAKKVKAKIEVHQRMKGGEIKPKAYQFEAGEKLAKRAERSEYEPFEVEHIDAEQKTVRFTTGLVLREGQPHGAEQEAIFREQVRFTVEQHMRRQKQFDEWAANTGGERVKVLSLFFIDKVANYQNEDGIIRKAFDEAFEQLKGQFPTFANQKAEQVRGAYFASKKRKGGSEEYLESKTGESEDDKKAYALIMKHKERLLSFAEPTAFLFSHTALREGWDNPNVFQICTLNQTTSETKKRQEIGRGMRLPVSNDGERVRDEKVGVLTVVANESYEDYVKAYQQEVAEEFGDDEAKKLRLTNARAKVTVNRKPLDQLPAEFRDLWERIKRKTRYAVNVDSATLIAHAVDELNLKVVPPPRIEVTKARVDVRADVFTAVQVSGARSVATLAGRFPLPNVVERIMELLDHTAATPVRLTRKTILAIVAGMKNQQAVLDNPAEFATIAVDVIRARLEEQLVGGIRYEPDGEWYEQTQFAEAFETQSGKVMDATKSLYDKFAYDSEVEKKFAEKLENRDDVKFYVKLPNWFKVRTPIGNYNPDWAVVMEEVDQFGDKGERLYLVRETKSTHNLGELRPDEAQKLRCGTRHFCDALDVDYRLVVAADELPGGAKIN